MGIEYLPEVEVGAKINPARLKERGPEPKIHLEQFAPLLKSGLRLMARETNRHYGEFLNEDGQIALAGPEAESDQELVDYQEMNFSRGLDRAEYRRRRETSQPEIAEMTLTLLFNKMLGDRFLVARASAYDDYNNGVDQVIIDKTTGAAVCGVDEVVSHLADITAPKKEEKLIKKMKAGGASVKYGATITEGRLVRQSLRHIPTFYVAVHPVELEKIITILDLNERQITAPEQEVFDRVIASLAEQYERLDEAGLDPDLRHNLKKFAASLERMKRAK